MQCRPPFAHSPAVCSSACSRVMSHEEYLRKHSIPLYMKDALVCVPVSPGNITAAHTVISEGTGKYIAEQQIPLHQG